MASDDYCACCNYEVPTRQIVPEGPKLISVVMKRRDRRTSQWRLR